MAKRVAWTVRAGRDAIWRAIAIVRSNRSSCGTTWLAYPAARASSALTRAPVISHSKVLA
ncbi:hypothetical protein D3C80_1355950 [compost metagenome]